MADVEIDAKAFAARVEKLFSLWEVRCSSTYPGSFAMSRRADCQQPSTEAEALKQLTALAIIMGEPNDDAVAYTKTGSLQVSLSLTWSLAAANLLDISARLRVSLDSDCLSAEPAKSCLRMLLLKVCVRVPES